MSRLRQELEYQHVWLEQALTDLANAARTSEATELVRAFAELEAGLLAHLVFEERELFPLVEPFHAEALSTLRDEHDRIRKLVAELGVRAELHALRRETVDELVELLRRHGEHEDKTLHHWIDESAPEDTRRHLLDLLFKTVRTDIRSGASGAPTAPR